MYEFSWHPNGNNIRAYGEWMTMKGNSPTCYVKFKRAVPDGHDTQAEDGYIVNVYRPHTYATWDDPNTRNLLMHERIYVDTLCEACAYVDQWCRDHADRWEGTSAR